MSRTDPASPTLPDPLRAVLDLFAGPLADVQFPDLDRARLEASRAAVEERRSQLQLALEQVQAAREQLELAQQELGNQARRAHAYATIYAEGDAALSEQLASIKLETRRLAPKKKKRGRPRKKTEDKEQTNLAVAEDAA